MTLAARFTRIAELVEELPLSERTLAVIEAQALLIERILATSPSDQADMALALAKGMG